MAGTAAGVQVVWFRRDLRPADHAPLTAAAEAARAAGAGLLPLYVFDPDLWRRADLAGRHWAFLREALVDLRRDLAALGQPLVLRTGAAVPVLAALHRSHGIAGLWAHADDGTPGTRDRDAAVAAWAAGEGIPWRVTTPGPAARAPLPVPDALPPVAGIEPGAIPETIDRVMGDRVPGWLPDTCPGRPAGGRRAGLAATTRFLERRLPRYLRDQAIPAVAGEAVSRLGPHLAWGTLSAGEVRAAAARRRDELRDLPEAITGARPRALEVFGERLNLRGAALADPPPDLPGELMPQAAGTPLFDAWSRGETGWPIVDAAMKALARDGWLPFTLRALVMQVAVLHLELDPVRAGLALARGLVDYEPAIHWRRLRDQTAGAPGGAALRPGSPVRFSERHDLDGRFIRSHLPALARLPAAWLHAPWTAPADVLATAGLTLGRDYPHPVADPGATLRAARLRLQIAIAAAVPADTATALPSPRRGRCKPVDPRQLGFDF
nr:FAD-binding domain-containing protein [uncultured Tistrella sp.]